MYYYYLGFSPVIDKYQNFDYVQGILAASIKITDDTYMDDFFTDGW